MFRRHVFAVADQVKLMVILKLYSFGGKAIVENHFPQDSAIGVGLPANMVAHQAYVHFWFLREQLLSDLHPNLDGQLVRNKLLLQHLIITTLIQLNIF